MFFFYYNLPQPLANTNLTSDPSHYYRHNNSGRVKQKRNKIQKKGRKKNQSFIHRLNSQVLVSSVWYKVIVNFTICVKQWRLSCLLLNSWRAKTSKLNMPLECQLCKQHLHSYTLWKYRVAESTVLWTPETIRFSNQRRAGVQVNPVLTCASNPFLR